MSKNLDKYIENLWNRFCFEGQHYPFEGKELMDPDDFPNVVKQVIQDQREACVKAFCDTTLETALGAADVQEIINNIRNAKVKDETIT